MLKTSLSTLLGGLGDNRLVAALGRVNSRLLADSFGLSDDERVERWMNALPSGVIADLCELDPSAITDAARWGRALAVGFGPGAAASSVGEANDAAAGLARLLSAPAPTTLVRLLAGNARIDSLDAVTANLVGWFFQAFDSCAGLIGGAIASLAAKGGGPLSLDDVGRTVNDLLARSPPISNTRRFTTAPITVGEISIPAGQMVLVVLSAGGRPFGAGNHRCPAEALAPTIATNAVHALWSALDEPHRLRVSGYRPSLNARIPTFA